MKKRGLKKKLKKELAKSEEKAPEAKHKMEVTIKSKILGEAPKEYHFVLRDNKKIKSVYELVDSLEDMGEDVFRHHVNEFRNDFSNWLDDVFDEKKLAEEIRHMRSRFDTQRKLMKRLIAELKKAGR